MKGLVRTSPIVLILGAAGVLAPACAAPSASEPPAGETSESAYTSGAWQNILTCDGGAAVLDVDTGERRNVQLVIRDRAIVDYLQSNAPSKITNGSHEIVIQASRELTHGVFQPSDFGTDDFWRYNVADFYPNAGIVKRDGAGIKVILADQFRFDCQGDRWVPDGAGQCRGDYLRVDVYHEVANWYFSDCR